MRDFAKIAATSHSSLHLTVFEMSFSTRLCNLVEIIVRILLLLLFCFGAMDENKL